MKGDDKLPREMELLAKPYTKEQVMAGDFPEDAVATGWGISPDGTVVSTFKVLFTELQACMLMPGRSFHMAGLQVDSDKLPDALSAGLEAQVEKASLDGARSRGGRAPKRLAIVQDVVDQFVANHPGATAREIWDLIPGGEDLNDPVYRDGEKVVQVDDRTGLERTIVFATFWSYVTRGRLRSN